MKHNRLFLSLLVSFCLVATLGCSKRQTVVTAGDQNQVLHYSIGAEVYSLDPSIATDVSSDRVILGLFEGLVNYDPETLAPIPGVAKSWTVSDDGLTYTFQLRDDARWSNGDPLTSEDFMYTFKRKLMPTFASESSYLIYPIKNAEAFNTGKITNFEDVGIKAPDAHTLTFTLEHPTPYFINLLQHPSTFPVYQKAVEAHGKIDDRNNTWTRPEFIVSNGPFLLKEWKVNDKIVVVKNPTYWDKNNIILNEVYYYPVSNLLTEERMFRSGALHITYRLLPEKIATYQKEWPEALRQVPQISTYFYDFNSKKAPLDNPLVRQALALCIDRKSIVDHVTKSGELPISWLTPKNTGGDYQPPEGLEFNPEQAKKLLAEAGYPDGKGLPPIEVLYNSDQNHRAIAEAIQQMWKKYLGINVTLANQDWNVFIDSRLKGNFQVARDAWVGDYDDPSTFLEMFTSNSPQNNPKFSDPTYDAAVRSAAQEKNHARRNQLFHDAEKTLLDSAMVVPIYQYRQPLLVHPAVVGYYDNLLDQHPLNRVALKATTAKK